MKIEFNTTEPFISEAADSYNRYMNKRLRNQPVHFYHLLKNKEDMNEVIENIIDKTKSRFYGAEGEQKKEMKMNTFKNKSTEIFYVVSLHIYAELFNSKDKTTSNMIITHVMDHEFVSKLIDLAMRNAEKHLLKKAWKKNADEKLSEVDFKEVKQALAKMHYTVLAESIC
ncbi:Uncharacterised protein [Klebsiella pneumoniae]|nr:Uncharacterised protein [Klebsiella pneumoniae]